MDANIWTQVISTVGFPIACCIALGVFVKYIIDKFLNAVADMNKKHDEEIASLKSLYDTMKDAMASNTSAIEKMNNTLQNLIMRSVDDGK